VICDGGATLPGVEAHVPRTASGTAILEIDGAALVHVPICETCARGLHDEGDRVRVICIVRPCRD
jgi:hypothetical protein